MKFTLLIILALASVVAAQTTQSADGKRDFGVEGLEFPQATVVNAHVPRTAQLLGDAYRKKDPLESTRVRLIADLGQTSLPAASPYLVDAMKDPSPAVRAEAARSAGMITGSAAALSAELEKLLADPDAGVRREAVLSAASLARTRNEKTTSVERGLADGDAAVVAAALQQAWTSEHAKQIAQKLPTLPKPLQSEAAAALGRLKATDHAAAVLPLLGGDVIERATATRALGEMGNAAQTQAVLKMLADGHPTVRREAVIAMAKLADASTQHANAIRMLGDADLTVREAAANVLRPVPSTDALAALMGQLDADYAPLHAALRASLIRPANDTVRDATIRAAAEMLGHANPRRREDASYVLGRLRSGEAFEKHLALLQWDLSAMDKADWALVAQAADSLGRIGDARASGRLMELVKSAPESLEKTPPKQVLPIGQAMGNALAALGRLGHQPALAEAIRLIKIDPQSGMPAYLRAASCFAIGALGEQGKLPDGFAPFEVYASSYEGPETKFEALKAVGNLRQEPSATKLKTICETDIVPEYRWIAHWSFQRAANTTVPYTPPTERREPPVTISDVPRQ